MNWTEFAQSVATDMGGGVEEHRLRAAVRYISRFVPSIDARAMRGKLADEVVNILSDESELVNEVLEPPFDDLSRALTLDAGPTRELVFTICARIDHSLDPEGRIHFRRNLGEELVESFARTKEARQFATGTGHHLSDGQPGSSKPLSEASPAQTDSIAADEDPHGDTKLSGARGITQEREHRTLAEGEPGSTRPLSTHEP